VVWSRPLGRITVSVSQTGASGVQSMSDWQTPVQYPVVAPVGRQSTFWHAGIVGLHAPPMGVVAVVEAVRQTKSMRSAR